MYLSLKSLGYSFQSNMVLILLNSLGYSFGSNLLLLNFTIVSAFGKAIFNPCMLYTSPILPVLLITTTSCSLL